MKYLIWFSRLFIGVLFIISGFIKLNDPLGFSFKLEEYFSPGVFNMPFLESYALAISVFIVIFEVILGVLLIIGYKPKASIYSLLGMLIFFSFLTFYSAYFNKVTDCGCFGDAIKLTPWESFGKDVILLVFVLIIYAFRSKISCLGSEKIAAIITGSSLLVCILFATYVLQNLPAIDFRAYKVGANIPEGMAIPKNAPKDVFEYDWEFTIDGKSQIIKTNGDYPDVEGDFIGVDTKLVQKGYKPPIHDFAIDKNGEDFTKKMMQESKLLVFISYDTSISSKKGLSKIKNTTKSAKQNGYKVIMLTASSPEQNTQLKQIYNLNFEFYFTDRTTLKTIVRSNPGVIKLNRGTITQKLHHNNFENLIFD